MGAVRLNQMGYSLNCTKQFVFVGATNTFCLYNADNNTLQYTGELIHKGFDEASGDTVCIGEFTSFQMSGNYYIQVNKDKSYVFSISKEQTDKCTDVLLKAFYYQRCGIELEERYAGQWKHPACHLQSSYLFQPDAESYLPQHPEKLIEIDTEGGWHDAGDYGRYTIATVKTVADLLLAYEHFTKVFDHSINIPESLADGADILHEVKIGLDFLFKMQRLHDGAVYTKVATKVFPGMIMPQADTEPLFVFDISSPATGGFAAVMALAARIYKVFDPAYAEKCLTAAKKAYQWLQQNQEPVLFKNPPKVISGEYGDDCDLDERYWAAAQLYDLTGEEQYQDDFLMYYFLLQSHLSLGWRNVGGYGTIAYLLTKRSINKQIKAELTNEWQMYANELQERSEKNGYGITLNRNEYIWGSMMKLQNQSIHLIIAERLLGENQYCDMIQNNWDYLFGMNPMDISYVTGMGTNRVMNPHHRPSAADDVVEPVPGLVAGGPCSGLVDEVTKKHCTGLPPAKCFVDDSESYSTNEIDIYWNSPSVYVGAYLCSRVR